MAIENRLLPENRFRFSVGGTVFFSVLRNAVIGAAGQFPDSGRFPPKFVAVHECADVHNFLAIERDPSPAHLVMRLMITGCAQLSTSLHRIGEE
jgi:hypothetical protein